MPEQCHTSFNIHTYLYVYWDRKFINSTTELNSTLSNSGVEFWNLDVEFWNSNSTSKFQIRHLNSTESNLAPLSNLQIYGPIVGFHDKSADFRIRRQFPSVPSGSQSSKRLIFHSQGPEKSISSHIVRVQTILEGNIFGSSFLYYISHTDFISVNAEVEI